MQFCCQKSEKNGFICVKISASGERHSFIWQRYFKIESVHKLQYLDHNVRDQCRYQTLWTDIKIIEGPTKYRND